MLKHTSQWVSVAPAIKPYKKEQYISPRLNFDSDSWCWSTNLLHCDSFPKFQLNTLKISLVYISVANAIDPHKKEQSLQTSFNFSCRHAM